MLFHFLNILLAKLMRNKNEKSNSDANNSLVTHHDLIFNYLFLIFKEIDLTALLKN